MRSGAGNRKPGPPGDARSRALGLRLVPRDELGDALGERRLRVVAQQRLRLGDVRARPRVRLISSRVAAAQSLHRREP